MRHNPIRSIRILVSLASCIAGVATVAAPTAAAETSYPDTTLYRNAGSLQMFQAVDREGVWFTSGMGLNCTIGEDGSYGCSGGLPGVPAGENEIGWFPGDPFPRLYHTDEPSFDSGASQQIMSGETFLTYRGSTCAATAEAMVYCINGDNLDSQLMVGWHTTYRGRNALSGG